MTNFQATNKSKDEIKNLGRVMLEAARKDAAGPSKGARDDAENLRDKEREIREKLVLKLKKKAEGDVEHQQGKITKAKTDGFESVSDEELSGGSLEDVSYEEDMEEISDEEMEEDSESEDDISEIDSEEELRLTSTDDDSDKETKRKKKRKKEKKEKKEKKKKGRDRERERDRESRKERELKRQIHLAERIASRRSPVRREARADLWEHEKYDRDREGGRSHSRRERTPTGYYGAKDYYDRRRRSAEREERDAAPADEFERDEYERRKFLNSTKLKKVNRFLTQSGMRKEQVEKEMERAYEKYFSSLARKEGGRYSGPRSEEQAKEEQWERMTNPHLFGGSGGGGFRKVKVGQHYEEVQKEVLQHEIRIRERRDKMEIQRNKDRGDYRHRDRGPSRRDRW